MTLFTMVGAEGIPDTTAYWPTTLNQQLLCVIFHIFYCRTVQNVKIMREFLARHQWPLSPKTLVPTHLQMTKKQFHLTISSNISSLLGSFTTTGIYIPSSILWSLPHGKYHFLPQNIIHSCFWSLFSSVWGAVLVAAVCVASGHSWWKW